MNLYFRLLITILKALRAPRVTPGDTVELRLRMLPTDLDLNGHMNNGRYLTLVDLGLVTVFIRSGGSIPIVGDFAKHLGIPTILMGFGLPDDGLHSPNEKYCIRNYFDGIRTLAHFFEEYGKA